MKISKLMTAGVLCYGIVAANVNTYAQAPACQDGQAYEVVTQWYATQEIVNNSATPVARQTLPELSQRLDKVVKLLQQAYPTPTGLEARVQRRAGGEGKHNEYSLAPKDAPIRYSARANFYNMLCDGNSGKVRRDAETGTSIAINVNWLEDFMAPVDDPYEGLKLANGQSLYFMPFVVGELKGMPVYSTKQLTENAARHYSIQNQNRPEESILITKDGKLPVRPVSREEYLRALQSFEKKAQAEAEKNVKKFEDALQQSLAGLDKVKFTTEAERQKAKQDARNEVARGTSGMAKEAELHKANIQKLESMLQQMPEEQRKGQAVFTDPLAILSKSDMLAALKSQEREGRPIVTQQFAPAGTQVPRHSIQFMQVYLKYETLSRLVAKPIMIKQFKENIDLAELQAMVGK